MEKIILNFLYFIRLHSLLHALIPRKAITVICLHEIVKKTKYTKPIDNEVFERLIQYLINKFEIITFDDVPNIISGGYSGKRKLIISFDDGHISFKENVLPILKKYEIKVNHNIVVNCMLGKSIIWTDKLNQIYEYASQQKSYEIILGKEKFKFGKSQNNKKNYQDLYKKLLLLSEGQREFILKKFNLEFNYKTKYLTQNDLIENKKYIEIGSHGLNHTCYNNNENLDILKEDLLKSKKILENNLNIETLTYALPNGEGTKLFEERILNKKIYKYILTTKSEKWYPEKTKIVPRISIYKSNYHEIIFQLYNVYGFIYNLRFQ